MKSQKCTDKKKNLRKQKRRNQIKTRQNGEKKKFNHSVKSKKAVLAAKKRRKKQKRKLFFFELFGAIAITGLLIFLLSLFLFAIPKVEGYSMVPTLREGERVYVSKRKKLKNFKLVYVRIPGTKEKEIRRIIGMPGQKIIYKNNQLQIDGQERSEQFIAHEKQLSQENGRFYTENFSLLTLTGKSEIPEGKYLLLGDNRPYSIDSRQYGLVDQKDIIGVVEMRILPLHLFHSL